jgi:outer membrane receptor for ferrienterochelin and colicins
MKYIFLSLSFFLTANLLPAQTPDKMLVGLVTNDQNEILIGASVYWKDSRQGAVTDTSGRFRVPLRAEESTLVVQYVGYTPAEVQVLPGENNLWIEIKGITELKQITIQEHGFGNSVSSLEIRNVERINRQELRKAPCCNLSESFETNGAVDVAYPNAITGVKEIQMLGLRGIYGQFLVENRPTMTGIATPFAFEYIPGTWLNGIVLAKGASSVKTGNAGITGQINADLVRPATDKPVFVNLFTSTEGRAEANVHLNQKGKKYTGQGLYLHGAGVKNQWDRNNDRYYDSPQRSQLNGMYRLIYDGPAGCAQFNVQALSDRRQSGQFSLYPMQPVNEQLYTVDQRNDRLEAWAKYGKEGIGGKPYNEIGNILSVSWHRNNSLFGRNVYQAEQRSFYWQSLFQTILGNTAHKIVLAPSVQYDDIQEKVNEGDLSRRELVPGAMAEYTFNRPTARMEIPDLVVVTGARLDWNSRFQRWLFTPRVSAKYNFTEKSIVRVSAGRGFRSANPMAENLSLLTRAKTPVFQAGIGLEEAWNYGMNYTYNFKIGGRNASISADAYRTDFVTQLLVDVDQSPEQPFIYNSPGKAWANSILVVAQWNVWKGLDAKIGYKWNDVQSTYSDGLLRQAPLLPRQRGLVTLDYTTPNKKWMFNLRTQILGQQRLPDNSEVPHYLVHGFPEKTPVFAIWNAQITRSWKKIELYLGSENISNYQQHEAIIDPANPWGTYFNGAQTWAPMMGNVVYLGVRYAPAGLGE